MVTVDLWNGTFREFHAEGSMAEIQAVVLHFIEILEGMAEAMVVMLMGTQV